MFINNEITNQLLLLNNKELKKIGLKVFKVISIGLVDRLFKLDIDEFLLDKSDYKYLNEAYQMFKKLNVKMKNVSKIQKDLVQ